MKYSEHLINKLVRHALKSIECSPEIVAINVTDVRKEVIERLNYGEYPQDILDKYSDNSFDKYTFAQLQAMKLQIEEAITRKL